MNKRKLWTLVTVPGLAVASLLLAFLLLGRNTVGAASDGPAAITDIQSLDTGFIISGTMFAPDGAVSGSGLDVCGDVWITETVDSAGNVGGSTSLVLEPVYPYTPHISHHADPSGDASGDMFVKHAWFNGTTWLSETVDLGCGRSSLALVPTYPHTLSIGYDSSSSAGCIPANRHVKFAWLEGTTWISRKVYNPPDWNLDAGGSSLALVSSSPYTPHIVNYAAWDVGTLYHAYLSGTIWVSGTWVLDPVEPHGSGAGSPSLALESTYPYTPHISYYDNNDLKHAWLSGTTWLTETVDSEGDVGHYNSLALDSNGNPHISYVDDTNNAIKYAWKSGTTWFIETVDNIGEPPYNRGRSSLELDQTDTPYISYYYAANGDLKLAHRNGTVWTTQMVDSEGDVGQYSSLALNQAGCPHISYHDATNGDLKYARPPVAVVADFTASTSPMCGTASYTVAFTNTSTGDYTESLWDFGDGVTSILKSPTHTYTAAGVYTVALTVSGLGGTDTATKTVYIKDCYYYLPIIMKN